VAYNGITKCSPFLVLPPDGPWPEPLLLVEIRAGAIVFYQFLGFSDPDVAPVAFYTSPLLDPSARFPFGFEVEPD
jgi:hypothetical protein